jgi:hypothetical protein
MRWHWNISSQIGSAAVFGPLKAAATDVCFHARGAFNKTLSAEFSLSAEDGLAKEKHVGKKYPGALRGGGFANHLRC